MTPPALMMTPAALRMLSPDDLNVFYAGLVATALPVGAFTGQVWGAGLMSPLLAAAGKVWQGKVFTGHRVRNCILGQLWVEGEVTLVRPSVVIVYPRIGLRDVLRPVSATCWLGRMQLGPAVAHFTLEAI